MPLKFTPRYFLTPSIVEALLRIERVKERVMVLPWNRKLLGQLRETARLYTTHYSTWIEGNRLSPDEVYEVIEKGRHIPAKARDEHEVRGYFKALSQVEHWVARHDPVTEKKIQSLHAWVLSNGRDKIRPTPYRDGQNVIRDALSRRIVYLPPEAKDVPMLMAGLVAWLKLSDNLPPPVVAAIAHYQFATIHPYYDGNGRTARLLTTWLLHRGGYDLKGLYSLEEYYATNLSAYYAAIAVGPSHNYYLGRAEADITGWIEYFCEGMAIACENVLRRMEEAKALGAEDESPLLRQLSPQQRKALALFEQHEWITARDIRELFGFQPRSASALCQRWVEEGFLEIVDPSKKSRKYRLGRKFH